LKCEAPEPQATEPPIGGARRSTVRPKQPRVADEAAGIVEVVTADLSNDKRHDS
jgi:hypothetical protein